MVAFPTRALWGATECKGEETGAAGNHLSAWGSVVYLGGTWTLGGQWLACRWSTQMDSQGSLKPSLALFLQSPAQEGPWSPASSSGNGLSLAEALGEPATDPCPARRHFCHHLGLKKFEVWLH